MARRVFMHIGAPKTGTTYLQTICWQHRDELAKAGVLIPGLRPVDRFWATLVVREQQQRLEQLPPMAAGAWRRILRQTRAFRGSCIISHEFFADATADQAATALRRLRPAEVHLVFTARSFVRLVPAMWQELLKYRGTRTLEAFTEEWLAGGRMGNWSLRTADPVSALDRWAGDLPPERIHVITVPSLRTSSSRANPLWARFAAVCGIDPHLVDGSSGQANQSLGVVAAELLRRTNAHIDQPIVGPREVPRWVRDELAHQVLLPLAGERFGLGAAHVARLHELDAQCAAAIRSRGWHVAGDLAELTTTDATPGHAVRDPASVSDAEVVDLGAAALAQMLQRQRRTAIRTRRAARRLRLLERELEQSSERLQAVREELMIRHRHDVVGALIERVKRRRAAP